MIIKSKKDIEKLIEWMKLDNIENTISFFDPSLMIDGGTTTIHYRREGEFSTRSEGVGWADQRSESLDEEEIISYIWKNRKAINVAIKE